MSLVLTAQGLTKRYAQRTVLDGSDFHVDPGEAVAITGESAAGKNTLLKLCALNLDRVDRIVDAGPRPAPPARGHGPARREGLLGRLLVLVVVALGLVTLFAPQILTRSADLINDSAVFALGLTLMALVSVPLGLAVGALVQIGAGRIEGPITGGVVHTAVSALLLLAVAAWLWRRRIRIYS